MKRIIILILLAVIAIPLSAKNPVDGVAQIFVFDADGEEIDAGTGIISGRMGKYVYLITAYHVVDQAAKVKVRFNALPSREFDAEIHEDVDPDLDLAVLVTEVPFGQGLKAYTFEKAWPYKIKGGQKVLAIGNPDGVGIRENTLNRIMNPFFEANKLTFSSQGMVTGYSGGPVLQESGKRLIGMYIEKNAQHAILVKIDAIIDRLINWRIPYNYLRPYKPRPSPISYVLLGLSGVATWQGTELDKKTDAKYQIFQIYRQENAPVYSETKREDFYAEALAFRGKSDWAYRSALALAGTAIVYHFIHIRKFKEGGDGGSPRAWTALPTITPGVTGGIQLGVNISF